MDAVICLRGKLHCFQKIAYVNQGFMRYTVPAVEQAYARFKLHEHLLHSNSMLEKNVGLSQF